MATIACSQNRIDNQDSPGSLSQFQLSFSLAILAALFGCCLYWVEKQAVPVGNRFARNPVELMVRSLGLAHFIVGWLFLLSSPRIRNWAAIGKITLGFLAGLILCLVFYQFGSLRNPYLYLLFYALFLYHEIRDEGVIYQKIEGVKPSTALDQFIRATAFGFLFLLALGNTLYQSFLVRHPFPTQGLWLVTGALGIMAGYLAMGVHRKWQNGYQQFNLDHGPLIRIFGYILIILLVSAPLGSIGFIVLLHVASWLVFVSRQLPNGSGQFKNQSLLRWLRSTSSGFLVLHLGLALAILLLLFIRVHGWHRTGIISDFFAESSFCYWALIHISMSFWSSR